MQNLVVAKEFCAAVKDWVWELNDWMRLWEAVVKSS